MTIEALEHDRSRMEYHLKKLEKNILTVTGKGHSDEIVLWFKCRQMLKKCELNIPFVHKLLTDANQWFYDDGKTIFIGAPTFTVNAEVAFNLYEEASSMSEEHRVMWAYYFAIMSILGSKAWTTTTSSMIKARLAGANSPACLQYRLEQMSPEQREIYEKYTTRRLYEKMLNNLQERGSIVEYGANRRTYISVKLSLKQLIKQALTKTGTQKANSLSSEKKKLKKELLKELGMIDESALPDNNQDSNPKTEQQ